jgi:metallo-beta-lactamase family protein
MIDVRAATAEHPLPDGEVRLLGAVRTVTGAMTLVESAGRRLLVDCGVAQGREASRWSLPEDALNADAIVLTHGHLDHVGSLPELWRRGWRGPVLGTRATLRVTRLSLMDGLGIERRPRSEIGEFGRWFDETTIGVSYDDLGAHVPDFDGQIAFREAGHILGSSSVEVMTAKSRVIVSGDLGRPDTPILRDPNTIWSDARPVDLVVMESTYGNRTHQKSSKEIQDRLLELCEHAIERKGHVLVPSFAIGRTQLLLYHLNELVESGRLRGMPVAVDTPMGLRVTQKYQDFRKLWDREAMARVSAGDDPLEFDDLYSVRKGRDSVRLRDVGGPMLIIAGSGMCTGGRIVGHLVELLPRPETVLIFVGYQARGTPGHFIQRAARAGSLNTVRLGGEQVTVRAKVATLGGLSAHADRDELVSWLGAIPGVRRVALHHGETRAQRALVQAVAEARAAA